MKISARGRYAIAACVHMAKFKERDERVPLIEIAEELSISKIYLEQVFAMLKKGGIVVSTKGANGGYQLAKSLDLITVYDILYPIETSLFEETKETVFEQKPKMESAIREQVYNLLDEQIKKLLKEVTVKELYESSMSEDNQNMFYI